jgi:putative membrane protein
LADVEYPDKASGAPGSGAYVRMALGNASDVVVGWGMMAMMFLFWILFIVGLVVGIRWLLGKGNEQKQDSAIEILRQRYARGEINKEEFEVKKKDLGG